MQLMVQYLNWLAPQLKAPLLRYWIDFQDLSAEESAARLALRETEVSTGRAEICTKRDFDTYLVCCSMMDDLGVFGFDELIFKTYCATMCLYGTHALSLGDSRDVPYIALLRSLALMNPLHLRKGSECIDAIGQVCSAPSDKVLVNITAFILRLADGCSSERELLALAVQTRKVLDTAGASVIFSAFHWRDYWVLFAEKLARLSGRVEFREIQPELLSIVQSMRKG